MEKLKRLPPERAFDPARLKSKEDWIRAGEIVFDAPASYNSDVNMDEVASPAWYSATGVPIAKDGTVPWVRYVIRGTGNVGVGNLSCGFCHTRVLPDGCNNWLGLFTVQWVPEMQRRLEQSSTEEILAAHEAISPACSRATGRTHSIRQRCRT